MENLELKNTISEIENSLYRLNSRLEMTVGRFGEPESKLLGSVYS